MPMGGSPFGLGTPTTAEAPPTTPGAGIRYINPGSKDYQQDSTTKQLAQMPSVRQQMLLAITTLLSSSSTLPGFGVSLPRKMGDTFEADVAQKIRVGCAHITDQQKVARIERITTRKGAGGRAEILVVYTDLTTGQRDEVSF
jgi:hypothetical protein